MLTYDIEPEVEAFSTNIWDGTDFDVVLPAHQAHGTKSVIIRSPGDAADTFGADALVTQAPGVRIGVKTADCVPVLLYAPEPRTVAAIHSGWKGTVADIIGITVRRLSQECGVKPSETKAVIGPCIHVEAFEVGDDVYGRFRDIGLGTCCRRMNAFGSNGGEKWHVDLPQACRLQLENAGVRNVDVRPECTYTLHDAFYSARRLGPKFAHQRILNCIMLRP